MTRYLSICTSNFTWGRAGEQKRSCIQRTVKEGGHQDTTQEDGRTAKMHWEANKVEKRRKLSPALTVPWEGNLKPQPQGKAEKALMTTNWPFQPCDKSSFTSCESRAGQGFSLTVIRLAWLANREGETSRIHTPSPSPFQRTRQPGTILIEGPWFD